MRSYRSERDAWIVVVLLMAMVAITVAVVATWSVPQTPFPVRVLSVVVVFAIVPLVLSTLLNTRYTFEETALRIVSGPFRVSVPYGEIVSVVPTRNPLSSPALSLDRLEVRWGSRMVLISPENRAMFLQELAAAAPQLMREGDSLRRR